MKKRKRHLDNYIISEQHVYNMKKSESNFAKTSLTRNHVGKVHSKSLRTLPQ
jgi:hypothetical protein